MEPLKRQILFNKKVVSPSDPIKKPVVDKEPQPLWKPEIEPIVKTIIENIEKARSEKIIKWFRSHELISVNGVCQKAGIDTSNFNKLLKFGKEIPDKILDKVEPIIKQYGFGTIF